MFKITCRICGTHTIWDDFKPTDIKCPRCGEQLNVHASFKENIEQRESGEAALVQRCPSCQAIVSRRWLIRCPQCRLWIFGSRAVSGKWFAAFVLIAAYLLLSIMYFLHFH